MKRRTRKIAIVSWRNKMKEALKGMFGLAILTPVATTAIGGLSALGGGLGSAAQSIVSVGFVSHAAKMSGASKIFKW